MIKSKLLIYTGNVWTEYQIYNFLNFDERKDGQLISASCTIITAPNLRFKQQRKARLITTDDLTSRSADYFAYFKVQKRSSTFCFQSVTLISVSRKSQLEPIDGLRVIQDGESNYTLYDTLSRLLDTTPLRQVGKSNKYHITTNVEILKVLKSIISPEFAWSCRTLLWECLKEIGAAMGGYVPSLSFANYNHPNDEYEVSFDNVAATTKTVDRLNYKSYSYGVDENDVCSELDSDIANIISTNQDTASVVYPSQNGFISPRTEEVRLTTDNCKLILPSTIERLVRVLIDTNEVKFNKNHDYKTLAELIGSDTLDITYYVVEKKLYDTLKEVRSSAGFDWWDKVTNRYKHNTIYWSEGSNSITISNGKWSPQYVSSSDYAIRFLIVSAMRRNYNYDVIGLIKNNVVDIETDIRNMRFRIEYIPTDSSTKLRASKQEKCDYEGVQIYNQRAEKVDSEVLSADLKKSVNQRGVEYFKTAEYYSALSDILPLGTAYYEGSDRYEIIVNEYEQTSKHHIKVTHSWSKNWSMLSPRLMQNKEYRNTNIPTDILERNLFYEDYCVVSTQIESVTTPSIIQQGGFEAIKRLWKPSTDDSICEVNNYAIYPENGNAGTVNSCCSFAVANAIVLCGKVKSNYSIGIALGEDWECHEVAYAGDKGVMQTALLQFGFNLSKLNNYSLPYCNRGIGDYQNVISTKAVEGHFYIDKSSAEKTNFTYQLNFVTSSPQIVIGEAMASSSPIIKGTDGTETLKIWQLNKNISKSASVIIDTDGKYAQITAENASELLSVMQPTSTMFWVSFALNKLIEKQLWTTTQDCKAWAVTDSKNRLIFAYNEDLTSVGYTTKTIYFNFTHKFHSEE
ncbi:MAG: hypothetical protein ACI4MN_06015 [Candidatus Coproplasma sp.]